MGRGGQGCMSHSPTYTPTNAGTHRARLGGGGRTPLGALCPGRTPHPGRERGGPSRATATITPAAGLFVHLATPKRRHPPPQEREGRGRGGGRRNRSYAPRHGRPRQSRPWPCRRGRRWRWGLSWQDAWPMGGAHGAPHQVTPAPHHVRSTRKEKLACLSLCCHGDMMLYVPTPAAERRGGGGGGPPRGAPEAVGAFPGSWSRRTAVPPGLLTPRENLGRAWGGVGGGGQRAFRGPPGAARFTRGKLQVATGYRLSPGLSGGVALP